MGEKVCEFCEWPMQYRFVTHLYLPYSSAHLQLFRRVVMLGSSPLGHRLLVSGGAQIVCPQDCQGGRKRLQG